MRTQRLMYEIQEARVEAPGSSSHSCMITVSGIVTCQHWTNPTLIESTDLTPPSDGIYEFTLVAEPQCPSEHSSAKLTAIQFMYELKGSRPGFRGVRIRASKNVRVALIDQVSDMGFKICISGALAMDRDGSKILCGDNGHTYELIGELCRSLQSGDQVHVVGTVNEARYCEHGTALAVNWISKTVPKRCREVSFL